MDTNFRASPSSNIHRGRTPILSQDERDALNARRRQRYHVRESKKEAQNAKRREHYQAQRVSINARRRELYSIKKLEQNTSVSGNPRRSLTSNRTKNLARIEAETSSTSTLTSANGISSTRPIAHSSAQDLSSSTALGANLQLVRHACHNNQPRHQNSLQQEASPSQSFWPGQSVNAAFSDVPPVQNAWALAGNNFVAVADLQHTSLGTTLSQLTNALQSWHHG